MNTMAPEAHGKHHDLLHIAMVRKGIAGLKGRAVTFDSVVLIIITMADCAWTLYLIGKHLAVEANPFMAEILAYGPWAFVGVKLLYTLPLIVVCEWLREFRPQFATTALRLALVAYLVLYTVGEISLHRAAL
jgi:hypothetical protein